MYTFFNRISPAQILFDKPDDKGGGISAKVDWPPEVIKGFKSLVSKQGGESDAALKLYEENYEHRKRIRELEKEIEDANSLSDEDAELFKKYKELGDDPEKLKETLENAEESQKELSQLKREKSNSEVAEVLGWNPKVLNRLSDENAEYEVKTRKNDEGEDEKYVVLKTDDGEKDLKEYAKDNWSEMIPALEVNSDNNQQSTESGKNFTKQKPSGGGKPNGKSYLKSAIAKNHEAAGLKSDKDDE